MDITLCAALSLDGKIADKNHSVTWISQEDQHHLKKMIHTHDVLIMGRTTFDHYKKHINPAYNKLRIIMTQHPKKHHNEHIDGRIEFSYLQPHKLIAHLQKRGYTKILVLGGSYVFSTFITTNVYTDIYITIEPLILGDGISFLTPHTQSCELTLIQKRFLNKKGTLLLHYRKMT